MIHFTEDGKIREPFIVRVLAGAAKLEDIDDEVDAWHKTGPKPGDEPNPYEAPDPLHEWLGLTKSEYARFVASEAALRDIVAERRAANDARRRTFDDEPINPDMGEGRYQDTLRRFRARIAEGLALDLDDSDFPGDKYTSASWGLCCDNDLKAYPDLNDHTFPARLAKDMRSKHEMLLSPRDPPEGATCPMDRGLQKPDPLNPGHQGCFYRCRLFRPVKGTLPPGERTPRPPTREEALKLYDDLIAVRERQFGRKTTADDGEARWEPSGQLKGKLYR